jgi:MurNAc alpha-1-phosphate uridylyltransferase
MPIKNMPHAAMVFAAGLGTRMRPITDKTPKPLVEVGRKALMDHMLDRFAEAGVARAVVNVHYLADQIEAHLAQRKAPQIIISDERVKLLDQGGGIAKALPLLGKDPFFICNTDSFWIEGAKSNLEKLAELWNPDEMDVLLLVAPTSNSIGVDWPGDFHMDPNGRLIRRDERDVSAFVYAGVGIIKPELFAQEARNETRDVFRLAPTFFAAAEAGRLFGARLEGIWLHVGTPEMIAEAEKTIARSAL